MDKTIWIGILLGIGLIAAFGDAIAAFLFRRRQPEIVRTEPVPEQLLEHMARDLASGEPVRMERATAAFLRVKGTGPVAYLTGLLRHHRSDVARQAAYILYERQDPEGLPPLYAYLANAR